MTEILFLKDGKTKIKTNVVSRESLLSGGGGFIQVCSHMVEGAKDPSWVPFVRALNPL
jgi:hypothetical protein